MEIVLTFVTAHPYYAILMALSPVVLVLAYVITNGLFGLYDVAHCTEEDDD